MAVPSPGARAGNVLFLIIALMTILFIGLVSFGYLTRTDVSTTGNLLRELKATQLGESIATQIEARTNCNPWSQRFWLVEALSAGGTTVTSGIVPSYTLFKGCKYLDLSGDTLPPDDYDFMGIVKDIATDLRGYRIYLEVTLRSETYTFTWDKRWDQGLMMGLNQESTRMDVALGTQEAAPTATDVIVERVRTDAGKADQPDGSGRQQTERLGRLGSDEKSFGATTLMPTSATPTILPSKEGG